MSLTRNVCVAAGDGTPEPWALGRGGKLRKRRLRPMFHSNSRGDLDVMGQDLFQQLRIDPRNAAPTPAWVSGPVCHLFGGHRDGLYWWLCFRRVC